jgi:hypothetical protein
MQVCSGHLMWNLLFLVRGILPTGQPYDPYQSVTELCLPTHHELVPLRERPYRDCVMKYKPRYITAVQFQASQYRQHRNFLRKNEQHII